MELRPYQKEALTAIQSDWASGYNRTLLVLPTGCHAEGQTVLMADGRQRHVEDVQMGDRLLGADGTARTVLCLHRGQADMYTIKPVKGEPFTVTGDHKLTLIRTNEKPFSPYPSGRRGGEIVDVSVNEWLTWPKTRKQIYKLLRCSGINQFPDTAPSELPVNPYFLGVLLGDGGITTCVSVTTPDKEIAEEIFRQAEKYGASIRTEAAGKAVTYFLAENYKRDGLKGALRKLGLYGHGSGSKFIPDAYKYADRETRLEVLAGLMDTDGSRSSQNTYDYITKSRKLAEDTAFICRSVGLAAYVSESVKTCSGFSGIYFRLSISGDTNIIPCRVKRKQAEARRQKKSVLRTGFSVSPAPPGDYYGFTVDGDNRYLLGDFTVTHNCGKTIVFSKLIESEVSEGRRCLILAHRGELLDQAADKLYKATGLRCATEKAEETSLGSWFRVTVGSVQSLMREQRLARFAPDYYDTVVVDEAHHALSDGYQRVLNHFSAARVLGVTATPDRGDMRNLGQYFEHLAYEYRLPRAIRDGYLCPIKAVTIPLKLDLSAVGVQSGDFKAGDLGSALDPYLWQIADEMLHYCKGRKTVVFLPLIATSQKFRDILNQKGLRAAEVNGNSEDRKEVISRFEAGEYDVLCNSMLLTEGWDCPAVDCIVVLRPTKIRSLYSQMVGRGTRICPGKDHLLLLDFLWHTERHELCHPACLICESDEVAKKMTQNLEDNAGNPEDITAAEEEAESDVVAQREEALAKQLAEMKNRKRKLVDPLQFEMSVMAEDLVNFQPVFGWQCAPPSEKQLSALEKFGIFPDEIDNAGKASLLLDRLAKRREEGLSTPKQIRFLESRGFVHVGQWQFETAKHMIDRIASCGWHIPAGIVPSQYIGA